VLFSVNLTSLLSTWPNVLEHQLDYFVFVLKNIPTISKKSCMRLLIFPIQTPSIAADLDIVLRNQGIEALIVATIEEVNHNLKEGKIDAIVCCVETLPILLEHCESHMDLWGKLGLLVVTKELPTVELLGECLERGLDQHLLSTQLALVPHFLERIAVRQQDQTALKVLEKKITVAREQFYTFFESFSQPILIHNFKEIILVNESFVKTFGYNDKTEIIGQPPLKTIVDPNSYAVVKSVRKNAKKGEQQFVPRLQLIKKDGSRFLAEAEASMLDFNGETFLQIILRDISEQERIRAAEKIAQKNLEYAQELAQLGSWEYDVRKDELFWSKQAYVLFEIEEHHSPNTLYALHKSLLHPEDVEAHRQAIKNVIEKGHDFSLEYRIITPKGGLKYLLSKGIAIKNEEEVISVKGTFQNITERKSIEDQLSIQKQNNLLLKHSEQVPGIIYQFKLDKNRKISFPFVGAGVVDLYGITPEEVMSMGKGIFEFVHEDDLEAFMASGRVSWKTMNNWSFDYRVRLPEKGIRWMNGTSKPVRLPDGSTLWHGYISDVTEQKRKEQALKDSEEQVLTLLRYAPSAIIVLNMEGRIREWNPRAESYFGWSKVEVLNEIVYDVISPERNRAHYKQNIQTYRDFKKGVPLNRTIEIKVLHREQYEFPAVMAVSEMILKGDVFFILFINDISQYKEATQKIKQSLKEKEVLLKEIHHRVKNNLQVVTSLLSLQSSFIEDRSIKEIFMQSQYRINSMGMVHEMLYQSVSISSINYGNYLQRLSKRLLLAMRGRDTKIGLELDVENINLNIDTAVPLGLIVNEILTNALKYAFKAEEAGVIYIELKQLEDTQFKLQIGDNGCGFSNTLDFKSATSLGLMLISKLTKQLNGSIKRLSKDKGTHYLLHFQEVEQID